MINNPSTVLTFHHGANLRSFAACYYLHILILEIGCNVACSAMVQYCYVLPTPNACCKQPTSINAMRRKIKAINQGIRDSVRHLTLHFSWKRR